MRQFPHVFTSADDAIRLPCDIGWFDVPEVRGDASSRSLELAWMRLRSTSPDPGPPLIVLEGGPGGTGLDTCAQIPARYTCFLEYGDVIVLDQRGVGCSRPSLLSPFRLELPLDRLVTQEEYLAEFARQAGRTAEHWRGLGIDPRGYTTDASADDVADLMSALGYDTFRTYGSSYGSHLSLAVLRRHGHRVERAYIALVEGMDDTYKLPSNTERQLDVLTELAASAPELGGRVPDLKGLMRQVFEKLEQQPVICEGVVIGAFDVKTITAENLGNLLVLKRLPALFLAMAEGDFTWAADQVKTLRTASMPNLMSLLVDCASGATPGRLRRIADEAPSSLLGDLINGPFPGCCRAVGNADAGEAFRSPVRSEVPVLFASGSLDGRTPASNAAEVRKGFPNSSHVLVRGAAHMSVHFFPEFAAILSDFMSGRPIAQDSIELPFQFESWPHERA